MSEANLPNEEPPTSTADHYHRLVGSNSVDDTGTPLEAPQTSNGTSAVDSTDAQSPLPNEQTAAGSEIALAELHKKIAEADGLRQQFQSLVSEAKSNQEIARASMEELSQIKAEMLAKKSTIETEANTISTIKIDLEGIRDALQIKSKALEEEHSALSAKVSEAGTNLNHLKENLDESKRAIAGIEQSAKTITAQTQTFLELSTKAESANTELIARQTAAVAKVSEIDSMYTTTQKHFAELFTDSQDAAGTIVAPSTKSRIDKLHVDARAKFEELSKLSTDAVHSLAKIKAAFELDKESFISKFTDQFAALKGSLEGEIRSLLPKAGAAGLASAYFDAKSRYASTPFKNDPDGTNGRTEIFLHYARSWLISALFYGMFVAPLVVIFAMLEPLMKASILGKESGFLVDVWLFRIAVASPLIAVSWFGLSSIRMYRRLYEEYNHKQRVMQLYHSFKDEISDEDQRKALLGIMLQTVGDKPSLVMPHYDRAGLRKFWKALRPKSDSEGT